MAALALALAMLVCPTTGSAQVDPYDGLTDSEANALLEVLEAAESAQLAGRWAAALSGYQEFLLRVPDPYVELDAATCMIALGALSEADALLSELIDRGDEVVRDAASTMRVQLRTDYPAQLTVRVTPPGARVRAHGGEGNTYDLVDGVETPLPPGVYRVLAEAEGFEPYEGTISLVVAEYRDASVVLIPVPAVASRPDETQQGSPPETADVTPQQTPVVDDAARSQRAASIVVPASLAGLAVGSLILNRVSAQRTSTLSREFNTYASRTPEDALSLRDWEEIGRQGRRSERVTYASTGLGIGFAVAAVVSAVVLNPRSRADTAARVTLEGGASRARLRIDW